ncbi:hypothetical protein A2526_06470 [candidate division WOR-1 bacterium RIFOXYD2_FULL_36_8]|uniref:Uncharacterized protein n=1 Tax=candidate division WOR-1 bacterium RIFOXYB2_FULL_36_35 TaxID=1802578 RepID=A0A1F4S7B3_UNCSA|nr:MAG: hypothetical protein A2230_01635 [candidate division WOR-1 bacterium RIFOXYA2_FULL_36_21]OGC15690.1 MAG: hypothetical protein A2282_04410 [candidate division WOR-1 bacterium RIFOXYA12_FULL_36_13]OGC16312.1 MAG: hypothetical protein A2290_04360 [candidate division WOR-1 bacterium RIFOXYB2_FULL_36_35]OGC41742.1 MAG: hypothetical protein A2526_06470 [candidate division WOR-1 bacterium RIFOXYD2_FULL_36_8]
MIGAAGVIRGQSYIRMGQKMVYRAESIIVRNTGRNEFTSEGEFCDPVKIAENARLDNVCEAIQRAGLSMDFLGRIDLLNRIYDLPSDFRGDLLSVFSREERSTVTTALSQVLEKYPTSGKYFDLLQEIRSTPNFEVAADNLFLKLRPGDFAFSVSAIPFFLFPDKSEKIVDSGRLVREFPRLSWGKLGDVLKAQPQVGTVLSFEAFIDQVAMSVSTMDSRSLE